MSHHVRIPQTRPPEARPAEPKTPEERAAEALAAPGEHAEPRGVEWAATGGGPLRRRVPGADAMAGPGAVEGDDSGEAEAAAETDGTVIPVPQLVRDAVLLLARVVLGVVLVSHGLQKVFQGVSATAEGFGAMGIPLPEAAAVLTMAVELGGGVLLILGLVTPIAGLLCAVMLVGAIAFAHLGNGIFAADGGWEVAAGLGVGALVLAVVGPGRFSLDRMLLRNRQA